MLIDIDQLIEIVRDSTQWRTVLAPHQNWSDEYSEIDITYVDADKLLEGLHNLKDTK
jgi:hypothetical protein